MRNLIVLGASALTLALGVAQASAVPTSQQWEAQVAARNAAIDAYDHSDARGFRAQVYAPQVYDQGAVQLQDPSIAAYHRSR